MENMNAMEEDAMMEESKKMEEKMEEKKEEDKKSEKKETEESAKTKANDDIIAPCCCCLCVCSNTNTENSSCFGCFPIKCGVVAIGVFTLTLAIILCTYNFFFILNVYVHWYFPVVVLVLLIPLVVAVFFFVVFFTKDTISSRGKLMPACQLTIISITLCCIWTICYFIWLYKRDAVYTGYGDPEVFLGYHKIPKKVYIFTILAESIILVALYAYFLCVCQRYHNDMKEEPEEKKEDEKAKDM